MSLLACPIDCTGELPEVLFNECGPSVLGGQLEEIRITNIGYPFTDVTDLGEWTPRLNQSGSNPDDIRRFTILGDLPAPEETEVEVSGGRTAVLSRTITYNVIIDDITQENYDMYRHFNGCNRQVLAWVIDAEGFGYGGNDGIKGVLKLNHIIPPSRGEKQTLTGTFTTIEEAPERFIDPVS